MLEYSCDALDRYVRLAKTNWVREDSGNNNILH